MKYIYLFPICAFFCLTQQGYCSKIVAVKYLEKPVYAEEIYQFEDVDFDSIDKDVFYSAFMRFAQNMFIESYFQEHDLIIPPELIEERMKEYYLEAYGSTEYSPEHDRKRRDHVRSMIPLYELFLMDPESADELYYAEFSDKISKSEWNVAKRTITEKSVQAWKVYANSPPTPKEKMDSFQRENLKYSIKSELVNKDIEKRGKVFGNEFLGFLASFSNYNPSLFPERALEYLGID